MKSINYDERFIIVENRFEDYSVIDNTTGEIIADHLTFATCALNLKFQLDNEMIRPDQVVISKGKKND